MASQLKYSRGRLLRNNRPIVKTPVRPIQPGYHKHPISQSAHLQIADWRIKRSGYVRLPPYIAFIRNVDSGDALITGFEILSDTSARHACPGSNWHHVCRLRL